MTDNNVIDLVEGAKKPRKPKETGQKGKDSGGGGSGGGLVVAERFDHYAIINGCFYQMKGKQAGDDYSRQS